MSRTLPAAPEFADDALATFVAASSAFTVLDVTAIREAIETRATGRSPGPAMHAVTDLDTPGGPARLYRPAPGPLPVVLHLHGGGWSVGSVRSFDRPLRRLAARAGVAVLGLDYRLAPEHRWPASVDDTVATLRWLATAPAALGVAPAAVGVCGDSAGGLLAALASARLKDEGHGAVPDLQVLVYANTDLAGSHPSMRTKATGYGLEADAVRFFADQWLPPTVARTDPSVSSWYRDDLTGLPPTVVVTAEHDPLRDEGEAYAERLRAAGVPVVLRREERMIHNFLQLDDVSPAAAAAADRVADDLAVLTALGGDRAHRPGG